MKRFIGFLLAFCVVAPGQPSDRPAGSKRGAATLASLVVPGSGQLLLGTRVRGEVMLWTDAALWAVYISSSWLGASRDQDARLVAAAEAGADLSITDPDYYKALERYDNSVQYNEDVRRDAREFYPDDPDAQRRYVEANSYTGAAEWDWSSDSARIGRYYETRRSARSATLAAGFTLGAVLLNRLVSAVDCAFFAREPGAASGRLEFAPARQQAGLELRYRF